MDLGLLTLFLFSFLAATILPIGSEPYLVGLLVNGYSPLACLITASIGNTLGGISSYGLGYLGKWEWLEKYWGVSRSKMDGLKLRLERYGIWLALLIWLPFVGDPIAVAMGFFRLNWKAVFVLMLIGKTLRYFFVIYLTDWVMTD